MVWILYIQDIIANDSIRETYTPTSPRWSLPLSPPSQSSFSPVSSICSILASSLFFLPFSPVSSVAPLPVCSPWLTLSQPLGRIHSAPKSWATGALPTKLRGLILSTEGKTTSRDWEPGGGTLLSTGVLVSSSCQCADSFDFGRLRDRHVTGCSFCRWSFSCLIRNLPRLQSELLVLVVRLERLITKLVHFLTLKLCQSHIPSVGPTFDRIQKIPEPVDFDVSIIKGDWISLGRELWVRHG
jgi:hypothetical protein